MLALLTFTIIKQIPQCGLKSHHLHNFNRLPILVSSTRLNHHTKSLIMKS
ncbi:hypothetical protein Scep_022793 [Stephania cephalantha]|uniref:Uncharacterized protein n=1 Tax=Stephania cephalantha TaxID=152367 RepID=A0AAP0F6V8_9MAGN